MANALPQAIGAQTAYPDRQVISLSGDGGLAMLMGELLTIAQYQLPVKIVLFNNHRLGMVQLEMEAAGLPHYGCELKNPNFAALAEAVGLRGLRVEDPMEVRPALEQAWRPRAGPGGRGDRPERADHAAEGDNRTGQPQEPIVNQLDCRAFAEIPGSCNHCVIARLKWVMRTMTKTGWLDNVQD